MIPLYQMGKAITIITAKPQNSFMIDKLEHLLKTQISTLFCFENDIEEAVTYYYSGFKNEEKAVKLNHVNIKVSSKSIDDNQTLSDEQQKFLSTKARKIFDGISDGQIPCKDDCSNVSKYITDEVLPNVDLKFCIRHLRLNDEFTYSHSVNTAILSAVMGKTMGFSTSVVK